MNNESKFLSKVELSRVLRVSMSTITRGVKRNAWPFNAYIKVGKQIRYPASLLVLIERRALNDEIGEENE
jgi:hypothetical protein